MARVKICVKSVQGRCEAGYKPGDCFYLDGFKYESKMPLCIHALLAITPIAYAIAKGTTPKELGIGDDEKGYLQCPDPGPPLTRGGTVVFELRRED